MRIIFASGNKGKIREASEILGEDYEIITPASLGINEEIEETGNTLKENSLIKAEYLYKRTGMNVFADDTGLEVDALGGACSKSRNLDKLRSILQMQKLRDTKMRIKSW